MSLHGSKVLKKLRTRNSVEVAPFVDIIELNNRLIVANSQLLTEREEIQFINVKLKEETQKLRIKNTEADQQQVSILGYSKQALINGPAFALPCLFEGYSKSRLLPDSNPRAGLNQCPN